MKTSDYLLDNKLYLLKDIRIQCCIKLSDYSYSTNHTYVELSEFIDTTNINNTGIIFRKDAREYAYWCDVSIFLEKYCKSISHMRDEKIDELFQ